MAKYKVESVWTSGEPYEFTNDKGQTIRLQAYYLDVVGTGGDGLKKVIVNQKPETPPIKDGDILDLEISDKMNKKGTHYKARKKSDLPPLVCPECGKEGPLSDFKPERSQSTTPTPNTPQNGSQSVSGGTQKDDDLPPAEKYDDIPF